MWECKGWECGNYVFGAEVFRVLIKGQWKGLGELRVEDRLC